ncbi:DUF222 domain-containing protein [Zhihengliuella sp.]|uniref:HNH endonuclease signature motif containing protein n=1 Tax=Zhihengliuella sp. TaxID=1954483 RepID=UPI0028120157|nr:DUF222 domain-containing protein [Zhihengliuella sp.]
MAAGSTLGRSGLVERWEALGVVVRELLAETAEAVCEGPWDPGSGARLVHVLEGVGRGTDFGRVLGARVAEEADLAGAGAGGTGRGLSEFKSTADWYRHAERVTTTETNRRLNLAGSLLPRRALTGEALVPRYPHLGEAAVAGEVSAEAAVIAVRCLDRVGPRAGQLGPDAVRMWEAMEENLAQAARRFDPRTVEAVAQQWEVAIDQDGLEPSAAVKQSQQGLFYKGRRQGLHRFHLNVTTAQFEILRTVTGAATNPRTTRNNNDNNDEATGAKGPAAGGPAADTDRPGADGPLSDAAADAGLIGSTAGGTGTDAGGGVDGHENENENENGRGDFAAATEKTARTGTRSGVGIDANGHEHGREHEHEHEREKDHGGSAAGDGETTAGAAGSAGSGPDPDSDPGPGASAVPVAFLPEPGAALADDRSRAQQELDGILAALNIALATDRLPSTGGQRPVVMVTIDHQTLLHQANGIDGPNGLSGPAARPGPPGDSPDDPPGDSLAEPSGELSDEPSGGSSWRLPVSRGVYTPMMPPAQLRELACDAAVLPAVLGGHGQVLDLGRAQRTFTAAQRRALTIRDRGCTFPGCTVPATWCEAHHVIPWHQGGATDVSNGALCCLFHHTLADNSTWDIDTSTGIPLWRPPATVDPQRPLMRNPYFHPETADQTALLPLDPPEPTPIPF